MALIIKVIQEIRKEKQMKPDNTYFTAHFNQKGELIGAEHIDGRRVDQRNINDVEFDNVSDIRELSIIMIPGNSPCCIKQGPNLWCWCG